MGNGKRERDGVCSGGSVFRAETSGGDQVASGDEAAGGDQVACGIKAAGGDEVSRGAGVQVTDSEFPCDAVLASDCERCAFAIGKRLLINREPVPIYAKAKCRKGRPEFHSPEGCELFRDVNQARREM